MADSTNLDHRSEQDQWGRVLKSMQRTSRFAWIGGIVLAFLVLWQLRAVQHTLAMQQAQQQEHLFWVLCQGAASRGERASAFLGLVRAGNAEWRSADASQLELQGVRLDGAHLQACNLGSTDLQEASLVSADLTGADLQLADLSKAKLDGAKLVESNFLRAKLRGTQLERADFTSAMLQQADMRDAELAMCNFSEATLLMADLADANLIGANFNGASLDGALLRGTNLTLANFAGASLEHTDFTDSTWWKARGFSPDQLAELALRYPPSESMSQKRRDEFALWLKEFDAAAAVVETLKDGAPAR